MRFDIRAFLIGVMLAGLLGTAIAQTPAPQQNTISTSPSRGSAAISIGTPFTFESRAIFNGNSTACNIQIAQTTTPAGVTYNNVQPGQVLPVAAINIISGGTTCSNLVELY